MRERHDMKIIGLTGSIGMGKTTTAKMFQKHGVSTIGSDDIVHDLYENEAVSLIEEMFPNTTVDGRVDRARLSKYVVGNDVALKKLENLIHPLVRKKQEDFIEHSRKKGSGLVLIDIPLLYETGAEDRFDAVVVVTCDSEIQRKRVLARENMTAEKFEAILKRQMPDAEKRQRADHIVDTSQSFAQTEEQVIAIIDLLRHS